MVAAWVAGTLVMLTLGASTAGAGPAVLAQDCGLLNPCESTTTLLETTTTVAEEPSTTVGEETTTSSGGATQTTARRSATTTTTLEEVPETTTTLSVTTSSNVLVPGDGTEGSESTTTEVERLTTVSDDGPSDGTLIGLVIVGLVLIAGVVSVLTWRYWVATRPPLREPGPDSGPATAG